MNCILGVSMRGVGSLLALADRGCSRVRTYVQLWRMYIRLLAREAWKHDGQEWLYNIAYVHVTCVCNSMSEKPLLAFMGKRVPYIC